MIEVGRLIMKVAGRDAGMRGVILDVIDNSTVMIDGEARRRKCNIIHLEPLKTKIKIAKNASHAEVVKAFKELGIELTEKKSKKTTLRQKRQKVNRKKKQESVETKSSSKKPKASKKKVVEKSSSEIESAKNESKTKDSKKSNASSIKED